LKIETQTRDDHQVNIVVELERERMERAKRRAARRISERKSVPGFRPGKAPYEVVLRTFGEGVIVEEAVDLLLDEVYPEALKESKVEPAAPGTLEKMDKLEETPTFTFLVPLSPTVDLGDYRAIRMPYEWQEPGEDKLEESLADLRQMYAKTETVERTIEPGDFVMVDLKGIKTKAEEGEAPAFDRTGFPVFIRKDEKADEWPFNGFSKELVGLNVGDSKSFTHKFPKDLEDESLKGQPVKFDVIVKMVRGTILPEMNDDFAKMIGPFETVQALRDAMKANLASQSKAEYDDDYFNNLIDKIKEGAAIKYAPQTIDHEVEHVVEDIKSRLAGQSMDLAAYLKAREMDEEKFIAEEARPVAVKRLERSLIMDEMAKKEKIQLDKEILNQSFEQTWSELQSDQGFQKSMKGKTQASKQVMNAVAMESANRAYVRQTLDRMKAIAIGEAPELEAAEKVEEKAEEKVETPAGEETPAEQPAGEEKVVEKKQVTGPKKAATAKKSATKKPASKK
jgi:trigger factor